MSNEQARKMLGIQVTTLRKESALRQDELAARAGLDRSYIIDVEKGRRNTSIATIARISWGLDMPISCFFRFLDGYTVELEDEGQSESAH